MLPDAFESGRRRSRQRFAAVLLVAASMISACASAGGETEPASEPTERPTPLPGATATPAPQGELGTVNLADGSDDLVDEAAKPVTGFADIDVVQVESHTDEGDLAFVILLAGAPPSAPSSTAGEYNFLLAIDTDSDSLGDYWVMLGNLESGEWSPSISDLDAGTGGYGNDFPGVITLADDGVLGRVRLGDLGNPDQLAVCVSTQFVNHADGTVLAEDNVPDGWCVGDGPFSPLE